MPRLTAISRVLRQAARAFVRPSNSKFSKIPEELPETSPIGIFTKPAAAPPGHRDGLARSGTGLGQKRPQSSSSLRMTACRMRFKSSRTLPGKL